MTTSEKALRSARFRGYRPEEGCVVLAALLTGSIDWWSCDGPSVTESILRNLTQQEQWWRKYKYKINRQKCTILIEV